jgi:hypothetical protein
MDIEAHMKRLYGRKPGDTVKGATALYSLSSLREPPMRVLIGNDAFGLAKQKLKETDE